MKKTIHDKITLPVLAALLTLSVGLTVSLIPSRYNASAANMSGAISGYGIFDADEQSIGYYYYGWVGGQYTARFDVYSGVSSSYSALPDTPVASYIMPVGEFAAIGQDAYFEDGLDISVFGLAPGYYTAAMVIVNSSYEMVAFCTKIASFNVPEPPTVELPPDPVKTGHTFDGWYLNEALTLPYIGAPIYEDTQLYAKFTPVTYTVIFYLNGGNFYDGYMSHIYYTIENSTITFLSPIRAGYEFMGWYDSSDFTGSLVVSVPHGSVGSRSYYAKWEPVLLTVTFYTGSNIYTEVSVPWGSALSAAVTAFNNAESVVLAVYSDPALHNEISVNTVLTNNLSVYAEVSDTVSTGGEDMQGFLDRASVWLKENWLYFPTFFGGTAAGCILLFLILKLRGAI